MNWENLKFLMKREPAWEAIRDDVLFVEDFLGKRLGPSRPEEYIHRNLTSNIYQMWIQKSKSVTEEIIRAAQARRSLG